MWSSKGKVAVVGIGFSRISRSREASLGVRTIEACKNAVNDAGLRLSDIDGIACFPEAPARNAGSTDGLDVVTVNHIVQHMEIAPHVKWYAQIEPATPASR